MRNRIRITGKFLLVGLLTTVVRIIEQLFIPEGTQDVLKPSIFVNHGTMPMAFTIYGILAYTIIAFMFLFVKDKISGSRTIRGLKYAISCCLVWVVYLLEPLPHVAVMDKFSYPIADSIALLVMGWLTGLLLCEKGKKVCENTFKIDFISTITISVFFTLGRMIQYKVIGIYSSYPVDKTGSMLWAVFVGFVLSLVMQWLNDKLCVKNRFTRPVLLGMVLFGVDLLLFNFFMPLVFDADIPDLIIRTCVDVFSVTAGCFFNQGIIGIKSFCKYEDEREMI